MLHRTISIGTRQVGPGHRCLVIAEAGVNHNGCLQRALQLVDVAAEVGADAVKFQTFRADKLVTRNAPKAEYQKQATGDDESQYDMLKQLELSEEDHLHLIARCHERGVMFLSTPFDETCGDLLDRVGVDAFKIPSGEVTNLPYLAHLAAKQRPMIVSTGMCNLAEVEAAVDVIEEAGNQHIILLHCVSNYPADPADVNLRAMHTMQAAFSTPVGYSDHTLGTAVGVAAVALGACVVEKHFTLDRNLPGPDHKASLEPHELQSFIEQVRAVEAALGTGRKKPAASEANTASVARKSLVAACDLPAGIILRPEHVTARRPGTGLPPAMRPHLLNRRVCHDVPAGSLITLEMLQ